MKQKQKTHKGAAKRFGVTGGGSLKRRRAFSSHLLEKKSENRKRKYAKNQKVAKGDGKNVKKMLGI